MVACGGGSVNRTGNEACGGNIYFGKISDCGSVGIILIRTRVIAKCGYFFNFIYLSTFIAHYPRISALSALHSNSHVFFVYLNRHDSSGNSELLDPCFIPHSGG
jgi:hypothetical protein